MNRFWQIAIGSCLVGTSLVATGCGKASTASATPVFESAVGVSGQRLGAVAAFDQQQVSGRHRLIARHSGKCLGVSDSSRDNHARLIQWDCDGGDEQLFDFTGGSDGHTEIHPVHSGKCLGVATSRGGFGAPVVQWDCTGGHEQQYSFEPMGDGFYKIHPRHSGKCLGVSASGQNNGAEVIQWDCVDVQDQHFKLD